MVIIPEDMDVPMFRRDTSKPENVRWLLRNLGARNSDHPLFALCLKVLKKLFKSMR
jgi:hypothetical protein